MMLAKSLQSAAGNAAGEANYIEDVFSTWLYTGNGSTQTITNGIDLAGEGGLVWFKDRSSTGWNTLVDTVRGAGKAVFSNSTSAEDTSTNYISSFTSSGFSLSGSASNTNTSGRNYASWTFRKQPKFFDVVTFSGGGGTAGYKTISHNLGSVPGCIIVKQTDAGNNWYVYHRGLSSPATQVLFLQTTNAATTDGAFDANPTSTTFQFADFGAGSQFVAYLFAHDAGGFGLTGTDNVISCGSYTGNGSATGPVVDLGYEPQWVLIKSSSLAGENWFVVDNMRGFTASTSGGSTVQLVPNSSAAESNYFYAQPTATGFQILDSNGAVNGSGQTYIYIAIRRGPMAVPTDGTEVFDTFLHNNPNDTDGSTFPHGYAFAPDWMVTKARSSGAGTEGASAQTRLTGINYLRPNLTNAESDSVSNYWAVPDQTNVYVGGDNRLNGPSGYTYAYWGFRRGPGFMDVVCWRGDDVAPRNITHNLTVIPEMMIVKNRTSAGTSWVVYHKNLTSALYLLQLETTAAEQTASNAWRSTAPTASVFTVGNDSWVNQSGSNYVNYLFATCPGVSKVGSYTGTGTTQTIDCGFTAGSRFVLIKRTDSTGDWYVWDSARGIVAGDDPYLLLNSTAAEVTNTDYIDTTSVGFEITSTAPAAINASGGTFIFLAIA